MKIRSFLLAALLPASLVACGGGGSDDTADGNPTPTGNHTHYVVSKIQVPVNNQQSRDFGLDLNNDNTVDNQLGMVLGTLAGQGIDAQTSIDTAVADGSIILLADIQTTDFTAAPAAGFSVYLGDMPSKMPCTDTNDKVCGHHLDGQTSFAIAADSPKDAALAGKFVGGKFTGGPGNLGLQIALGDGTPISLSLVGARVAITGVTATGITSAILGGAVTQDDLNNKILPAVHDQILVPILTRDCKTTPPPGCGCADGSSGKQLIGLFDTSPADCNITLDEIKNNGLFASLLAPDVTIDVNGTPTQALSLGVKATAVGATFPQQ